MKKKTRAQEIKQASFERWLNTPTPEEKRPQALAECGGCGITITSENNSGDTMTDVFGKNPQPVCVDCAE